MYFLGKGDFSTDNDALLTATTGLVNPSFIIFMTSQSHLKTATRWLQRLYPHAQIMGGAGYIMQGNSNSRDAIQIVGFEDEVDAICGIIPQISECPVSSVGGIIEKLQAINAGTEDTICMQFSCGYGERIVTLFESVIRKSMVPMIGGATFDWDTSCSPAVCLNGIVYEDACVYAFIKNKHGKIRIFRENIYKIPDNAQTHLANKVNRNLYLLQELDAVPAGDVYFNEVGFDRRDIVFATMLRPLGRVVGDDVFVIALANLMPDGTIVTNKKVGLNDSLYILTLDDVAACVNSTTEDISAFCKNASLIVCMNSVYRQALFDKMNFTEAYCSTMEQMGPFASFIVGSEQGFGQNMNQSMVCMAFE